MGQGPGGVVCLESIYHSVSICICCIWMDGHGRQTI